MNVFWRTNNFTTECILGSHNRGDSSGSDFIETDYIRRNKPPTPIQTSTTVLVFTYLDLSPSYQHFLCLGIHPDPVNDLFIVRPRLKVWYVWYSTVTTIVPTKDVIPPFHKISRTVTKCVSSTSRVESTKDLLEKRFFPSPLRSKIHTRVPN